MDTDKKPGERSAKRHAKIGVYEQFSYDNSMKNRSLSTSIARNMKHGWCQMVNSAVHYFRTPFNVSLIVEHLSNYNMLLPEQIENDDDGIMKQNDLIRDDVRHGKKLSALATECTPNI